jgi:hypothetical protein
MVARTVVGEFQWVRGIGYAAKIAEIKYTG